MNNIERLLNEDPISQAEILLGGKSYKDFDVQENILMLALARAQAEEAVSVLKSANDTYHSMPWGDFKNALIQRGFSLALSEPFSSEDGIQEECCLFYGGGLVLFTESFAGVRVNSGTVYGQLEMSEDKILDSNIRNLGMSYSYEDGFLYFRRDVREGLFYVLGELQKLGKFIDPWKKCYTYLHFCNYSERGKDYKAITNNRIEKCPEIKRIVEATR